MLLRVQKLTLIRVQKLTRVTVLFICIAIIAYFILLNPVFDLPDLEIKTKFQRK